MDWDWAKSKGFRFHNINKIMDKCSIDVIKLLSIILGFYGNFLVKLCNNKSGLIYARQEVSEMKFPLFCIIEMRRRMGVFMA